MRISTRTGRNTRISMSPMGWLILGPLIAAGYLLYWAVILVVGGVTLAVAAIGAHLAKKATVPKAAAPTMPPLPGSPATHTEDAIPPGYMPQRPQW